MAGLMQVNLDEITSHDQLRQISLDVIKSALRQRQSMRKYQKRRNMLNAKVQEKLREQDPEKFAEMLAEIEAEVEAEE